MEAIRSFPGNFVQRHILGASIDRSRCCLTLRAAMAEWARRTAISAVDFFSPDQAFNELTSAGSNVPASYCT